MTAIAERRRSLLRDAHYYGGTALAGVGLGVWVHYGAGLVVVGAGLVAAVILARDGGA